MAPTPKSASKTAAQVLVTSSSDGLLMKNTPASWNKKVRLMRRDATLGFIRDLYMAPILISDWTVVSDDPKYKNAEKMVFDSFVPKRRQFLRHAVRGILDFGWQSYEKVFGYDANGYVKLRRLKPLLQDITEIRVNDQGEYIGIRNQPIMSSGGAMWTDLSRDEALLLSDDVEGSYWYGEARMRRAEGPYDSWNSCNDAADRFDRKIAGAHWVVYYPLGFTLYNGVSTDNFLIATAILNALESSGKIAIPQQVSGVVAELSDLDTSKTAWKVELLSANTTSASSFVDRQRYLDSLKSRALGIPERAILEGQFGTLAESEAHADFAISNIEMGHQNILEQLNEDAVNQLLTLNHGAHYRDHVKLIAMPLSDFKKVQLKELYSKLFDNPDGFAEEMEHIDWDAVREQLDIPTKSQSNPQPLESQPNPPAEQPKPKGVTGPPVNPNLKSPEIPPAPATSNNANKLARARAALKSIKDRTSKV